MKLAKPWDWNENAIMYTHPSEVVHEPYPFYWYRVTGLQIELIKQVSKFCGVVQAVNEFIPTPKEVVVEATPVDTEELSISAEWKSWSTLGEVVPDPLPLINTYVYGNIKHIQYLKDDGQISKIESYENDQLIYTASYDYKKIKGGQVWIEYRNSLGVKVIRETEKSGTDKNMKDIYKMVVRWISGKPIENNFTSRRFNKVKTEIDQYYGKRK